MNGQSSTTGRSNMRCISQTVNSVFRRQIQSTTYIFVFWTCNLFSAGMICRSADTQANNTTSDSVELAQVSTFVFNGTVQTLNGSTVSQAPASAHTAIVRVDSIARCSTNVCGSVGKLVTVKLLSADSVKNGEQYTFFTQGWLLGNGVAVIEIKHITPALSDDVAKALLSEGSKAVSEQILGTQLASAACVITGEVLQVRRLELASDTPSEHQAHWQDATVKVLSIEKKGCLPAGTKTVDVLFPSEMDKDTRWVAAPRFHVGQTGVWILYPGPNGKYKTGAAPSGKTYSSPESGDFRSLEEISTIRSLLQKSGANK
jgi:hypothetical protein